MAGKKINLIKAEKNAGKVLVFFWVIFFIVWRFVNSWLRSKTAMENVAFLIGLFSGTIFSGLATLSTLYWRYGKEIDFDSKEG